VTGRRYLHRLIVLSLLVLASVRTAVAIAAVPASELTPVDGALCTRLQDEHVMRPGAPVRCSQLQVLRFSYAGFDGRVHDDGEIMVMAAVAPQVQTIFKLLLAHRFPLACARLMENYHGDDAASMADNNTSAFNHRPITGGSVASLHAYGLAIDINPVQNPFIRRDAGGLVEVSPPAGKPYATRLAVRPGMVDQEVVAIFAAHGFPIWGGDWRQPTDYQHFQVSRKMAERLAALPLKQATAYFENGILVYRRCLIKRGKTTDARKACALAG